MAQREYDSMGVWVLCILDTVRLCTGVLITYQAKPEMILIYGLSH